MRIKLVRRRHEEPFRVIELYDIYVGIRSSFFPFRVKWYLDEKGLSEHEAKERIWDSYLSVKGTRLITEAE